MTDDVGNERIGEAVRLLRGDRTQGEVARQMRDLGHKWSQATVWSVETGERPLRLTEARSLCTVLDCQLEDLWGPPEKAGLRQLDSALGRAWWSLAGAVFDFQEAREAMQRYVADLDISREQWEETVKPWRRPLLDDEATIPQLVGAILDPEEAKRRGLLAVTSRHKNGAIDG